MEIASEGSGTDQRAGAGVEGNGPSLLQACGWLRFGKISTCRSAVQPTRTPVLVLFTDGLGIGFAVGIEEFLAALLPRRLEFRRCDVPVRPAFLGHGT
jgi:hypothetical protein